MDRSNSGRGSLAFRVVVCVATMLLLVPLLAAFSAPAQAQDDGPDEVVIFVLDLSGSMNEPFDAGQTKLDVAKAAFIEAFANVSPDARVGLRTYGDQIAATTPADREPSCTSDTRVASPVAPLQRDELIAQVQSFTALGDTPMGLALERASTDIPAGSTGTIVLFSDGRDECFDADLDGDPTNGPSFGQDPCEIAKTITDGDSPVDRIVTVGFRAGSAAETELRCIADSTGGTYTPIETPEDARDALPELLVQLSAPREAQRLVGREIQGATSTDGAPDFVRLDELGVDQVLYTDSIDMNSVRIYRMPEYGPEGGTFTATVFGLPAELGIAFDMRIYIPELDQRFFQGEHGDFDAGLPGRPTASIRCTDCQITGGPHEAFFVVTLDAEGTEIEGTYELEILTEGPGFGGSTTSCSAPQECFYPQEIINLTAELEAVRSAITDDVGELAPPELIAERDQLRIETNDDQEAVDAANARAEELEARIPLAPAKTNSFRLPLLMMLVGVGLALLPVQKLRREKSTDDDDDDEPENSDDEAGADEPASKKRGRKKKKNDAEPESDVASASETPSLPSLDDVGPPPAISPNLKSDGNSWDAELEAAKAALAQQRPERAPSADTPAPPVSSPEPASAPAPVAIPAPPAAPAAEPVAPAPQPLAAPAPAPATQGDFTAEQHAAAKAAAEKIAAQRAAEQAAAEQAAQAAAEQAAAEQAAQAAAEQAAAEQAAAEQAAAEQAAAEQAKRAAAEQAAAKQAAAEAAAKAAAAKQAAAEAMQRAEAERAAAEKAAREAAERAAAEKAAREAAERLAAEKAATEKAAAERLAAEAAAKAAAEKAAADRAAAEKAAADRAAAEEATRQAAQRLAAEKAAAEQAARERAAAELAAAEAAAQRVAAEEAAARAAERAAQEAAASAAAPSPAVSNATPPSAPMTEEERRQEARRRMLAKQNIVASSSGPATSAARESSAGTAAALRPMTVPPKAAATSAPAQRSTPEAPGWYEDPAIVGQFRWWDGATWTGHTSQTGQEPAPS